jgi:hypothetical protein
MHKDSIENRFERLFGRSMTPSERVWYSVNKPVAEGNNGPRQGTSSVLGTISDAKSRTPNDTADVAGD